MQLQYSYYIYFETWYMGANLIDISGQYDNKNISKYIRSVWLCPGSSEYSLSHRVILTTYLPSLSWLILQMKLFSLAFKLLISATCSAVKKITVDVGKKYGLDAKGLEEALQYARLILCCMKEAKNKCS